MTMHPDPHLQALHLDPPVPPAWVAALLGGSPQDVLLDASGTTLRLRDAREYTWLEWTAEAAVELPDADFRRLVSQAYESLGSALRERGQHPLRLWNYLPDIRRPSRCGFTRYEVFNAGRREGYRGWLGPRLEGSLPASSAVGYHGKDCVIHVLAGAQPGLPVENPRQCPAYRYSRRYGPVPPSFARATLVRGAGASRWAALSGTASIVGEESRHVGDLRAQLDETLANLSSVVRVLGERAGIGAPSEPLARCREIRAYVPHVQHVSLVQRALRLAFANLERLEIAHADLCRPELLVELEGRVDLNGHAALRA
jgi:chorismate lyase/3-hydroxybenzoate synthase